MFRKTRNLLSFHIFLTLIMTRKKHTEIEDNKKCMWAVTRSAVTGVILKILGS